MSKNQPSNSISRKSGKNKLLRGKAPLTSFFKTAANRVKLGQRRPKNGEDNIPESYPKANAQERM